MANKEKTCGSLFDLAYLVKSEIQVREIFFKYAEKLGFKVVESRSRFPDYVLEGKSGIRYTAEAEYDLANFVYHNHNPREVDFIVFWEDSLKEIPEWYAEKYGLSIMLGALINLKKTIDKMARKGG